MSERCKIKFKNRLLESHASVPLRLNVCKRGGGVLIAIATCLNSFIQMPLAQMGLKLKYILHTYCMMAALE